MAPSTLYIPATQAALVAIFAIGLLPNPAILWTGLLILTFLLIMPVRVALRVGALLGLAYLPDWAAHRKCRNEHPDADSHVLGALYGVALAWVLANGMAVIFVHHNYFQPTTTWPGPWSRLPVHAGAGVMVMSACIYACGLVPGMETSRKHQWDYILSAAWLWSCRLSRLVTQVRMGMWSPRYLVEVFVQGKLDSETGPLDFASQFCFAEPLHVTFTVIPETCSYVLNRHDFQAPPSQHNSVLTLTRQ